MDTMDLSGFDMSNAKSAILGNLTKNLADKHMASVTTPNLVNQLMSEYGNDEIAVQAIMKLSLVHQGQMLISTLGNPKLK